MNKATKVGDYTVVTYFDATCWENVTSIHNEVGEFLGPISYSRGESGGQADHMSAILYVETEILNEDINNYPFDGVILG